MGRGGAAATVLLVVVWVGSAWWQLGYVHSNGDWMSLRRGRIEIYVLPNPTSKRESKWTFAPVALRGTIELGWEWGTNNVGSRMCYVPLWLVATIPASISAAA